MTFPDETALVHGGRTRMVSAPRAFVSEIDPDGPTPSHLALANRGPGTALLVQDMRSAHRLTSSRRVRSRVLEIRGR